MLRGTAFLHCRTQSIEQPRIQWVQNHTRNVGNSAKAYTYENGTLRILDSSFEDSGAYTCRARTSGGQSEATMHLTVMDSPRAHVEPRELYAAEGSTFNLTCAVEGWPEPEVTWYFRGRRAFAFEIFYMLENSIKKAIFMHFGHSSLDRVWGILCFFWAFVF
jgi:hemicentin